jgi:Tfp pilus assembly protein PilF
MSLLLDALKRAEQEKHARQGPGATPETPSRGAKPALELAPIASPESVAPARASTAFPAAAPPKAAPESKGRKVLWIGGALIALVVLLAVGYIWYSIDALSPRPVARVPAPRPITPAPAPALEPPKTETVKAEAPAAAKPATPAATAPAATAPAAKPKVTEVAMDENAPPAVTLQPSRGPERARIPPEVAAGYEALRRGDLASARRNYAAAQAADATNLDAALGLATVEAQSGNRDLAFVLYRRALDIDPRNATALAGLAALSDLARPEALEPQLLRDIAQQPASSALHFMLGNLYASQSRWSQAQAAYFEAHRLDPANPDIAHNLAVSLDRLGQARAAADYYRRALEGARAQAAQFDAAAVQKRLSEIDAAH